MKEKRVVLFIILLGIFLLSSLVFAAEDKEIEKSYTCLKDKLGSNCADSKNTEQLSFSLLAIAHDSKFQGDCKTALKNKKDNNCWGDKEGASCDIKSTAIATLAFLKIDDKSEDSLKWLIEKRITKTGLTWYLEIDSENITNCDINGRSITVNENKKLSGSDPSGLRKSYNNYWYEITDPEKNYTVTCDKEFITTLLYQRPGGGGVIYVSSASHRASGGDSTTEVVLSYCFSTGSTCDYEGSLWAALAIAEAGEDISSYIPYLTSMSEDSVNKKYLPVAFLHMLTNADDYLTDLASLQREGKYWDVSGRKYYDSSIALMSLQGENIEAADNSKKYFLTPSLRGDDGCWNDVYITALLLYSGWPRSPASSGISGTSDRDTCEQNNYYCIASLECGEIDKLDNFNCFNMGDVCCRNHPAEQNCSDKGGLICGDNQECTGTEILAAGEKCCMNGACQDIVTTNECEDTAGGSCATSCTKDQELKDEYSKYCEFGEVCCKDLEKSPTNWLLIILLIILIMLVILAIIFRNQLKIWLFRMKSGFKSNKSPPYSGRPISPPPYRPVPPMSQRPTTQRMYPVRGASPRPMMGKSSKDRDFEETMKKLRDMSK
ncbi:MAG: hypothetical protein Q8N99_04925 [Nanoarchaeota archaeon]|nr:hypothetical protein [Nanoarchaeota archaeon]